MADSPRDVSPEEEREPKRRPLIAEVLVRLVKEKPMATVGGVILLVLVVLGVLADIIAPYGANQIHLVDRFSPPSAKYLLGTDNLGRDLFSRIVYGARISMYVGLAGAALDVAVTTIIGLVSGYFGGKIDMVIQRFVDAWICFPPLLIYLTVMSLTGPGLIQVILVLGITDGIRYSRVVRGAVIGIRENVYVEAARAVGATNWQIMMRHILPNIMAPIIIIYSLTVGYMILAEATLSFLGFGVSPETPSWGAMLSLTGRRYMFLAPWTALWPGLALATAVWGINMLGDGVRDILDPRLRGGLGRYGGTKVKKSKQ